MSSSSPLPSSSQSSSSPGEMPTLLSLPLEILTQTLTNLPHTSLLTCKLTCKHFNDLIRSSAELQYILAKAHASVDDSPSASSLLSTADKLALLENRENSWLNFDYTFKEKVELPVPTSGLYDVTPNAYFLGCAVNGNRRATDSLMYARLPSRKGEVPSWDKLDVGSLIVDFGTSVEEHDLIALIVYRNENSTQWIDIVLRRFSNGLEHPHAEKHTIPVCKVLPELGPLSLSIEIAGENLVLCVDYIHAGGIGAVMFVFDWMRGVLKFKPTPISNNGLVFLRHDIFIQPDINQLTIDAYYIPPSSSLFPSSPSSPSSSSTSNPTSSTSTSKSHTLPPPDELDIIIPFESLRLPQLHLGMEVLSISCRGDPSPRDPASVPPPPAEGASGLTKLSPPDSSAAAASTSSAAPSTIEADEAQPEPCGGYKTFTSTPEDAIIILTLDMRVQLGAEIGFRSFSLLVPRHRLLSLILPALSSFESTRAKGLSLERERKRAGRFKGKERIFEEDVEEQERFEQKLTARQKLYRMSWLGILEARERVLEELDMGMVHTGVVIADLNVDGDFADGGWDVQGDEGGDEGEGEGSVGEGAGSMDEDAEGGVGEGSRSGDEATSAGVDAGSGGAREEGKEAEGGREADAGRAGTSGGETGRAPAVEAEVRGEREPRVEVSSPVAEEGSGEGEDATAGSDHAEPDTIHEHDFTDAGAVLSLDELDDRPPAPGELLFPEEDEDDDDLLEENDFFIGEEETDWDGIGSMQWMNPYALVPPHIAPHTQNGFPQWDLELQGIAPPPFVLSNRNPSASTSSSSSYSTSQQPHPAPDPRPRFFTPYDQLHHLAAYPGSSKIAPLHWDFWGLENTRMFDCGEEGTGYITVSSGTRYVRLVGARGEEGEGVFGGGRRRRVEVVDFSRARVRAAQIGSEKVEGKAVEEKAEGKGKGKWRIVNEEKPSVVDEHGSIFRSPVETRLPYISTVSEEEFAYDAVLVDEERIIGKPFWGGLGGANWESGLRSFEVLYFG